MDLNLVPSSLYMHLPWCVKKCPYCDFNSHEGATLKDKKKYIAALKKDIAMEGYRFPNTILKTIFIGGGTPNLFMPEELNDLLNEIKIYFKFTENIEITMEVNPGLLEKKKLTDYKFAGINRLSIGAQSFDSRSLKLLGRIHSVEDIFLTIENAQLANFKNINLDLMFGLPSQTMELVQKDLEEAINLNPQHISYYQLTLEPNTVFYKQRPKNLPSNDRLYNMHERGLKLLEAANYIRYEVSAFSKIHEECQHNLNYWTFGDYIAVGAGAHGKYTINNNVYRYQKPSLPRAYINTDFEKNNFRSKKIEQTEIIFDFMLNNLRLISGFTETYFEDCTDISFNIIKQKFAKLQRLGLIQKHGADCWQPTALGLRFLDDIQVEFLPQ